jgi:hypothetical protein
MRVRDIELALLPDYSYFSTQVKLAAEFSVPGLPVNFGHSPWLRTPRPAAQTHRILRWTTDGQESGVGIHEETSGLWEIQILRQVAV